MNCWKSTRLRTAALHFFLEFEKELRLKYHLYDKAFVEYHTDPGQKIYDSF